ncbi:MAG: beta-N-acetylhexosaminidase [Bacteroidota bacterium]|nr:beta-N-acetylhexosaminidase [Bacteroidota bacterium]
MKSIRNINFLFAVILIFCLGFSGSEILAQKQSTIIPAPASITYSRGHFRFNKKTSILVSTSNHEINEIARYLADQVKTLDGLELPVVNSSKPVKRSVVLKIDQNPDKKESYSLVVSRKNITIDGASSTGLFYGVQSLLQLISPQSAQVRKINIPCQEIQDSPSFAWRGMHLDVCRHFFPVECVKRMIDMLALHKMNVLHWHLTDDQGWRIEIKRYPKLTEIGGWRNGTLIGHYTETGQKYDSIRYGGFYTQDQIREVVKYAQSRFVTVIPEIEMPGHAVAALTAYPQYSCTGGPFEVRKLWGVSDDVYCAGKEETFEFLENILTEVMDLFPGEYIHIGGDECPKARWKECPYCQKRIKDEGLKDELELQSYFVKRIEKYIASKGKKMIGWDEILEGGLPERATVMSWRGIQGGIEAAQTGHDVIMTPGEYCYFDHYQAKQNEPLAIGGFLPLEKVYSFNPVPPTLSADKVKHILGAQANVWTEYIPTESYLEYMIFPRLCAMSEVLWTPKEKQDYSQFQTRLKIHLKRLDKLGIHYRPLDQVSKKQ